MVVTMTVECGTNLNIDPFLLGKSAQFIHENAFGHIVSNEAIQSEQSEQSVGGRVQKQTSD